MKSCSVHLGPRGPHPHPVVKAKSPQQQYSKRGARRRGGAPWAPRPGAGQYRLHLHGRVAARCSVRALPPYRVTPGSELRQRRHCRPAAVLLLLHPHIVLAFPARPRPALEGQRRLPSAGSRLSTWTRQTDLNGADAAKADDPLSSRRDYRLPRLPRLSDHDGCEQGTQRRKNIHLLTLPA